MYLIDYFEGPRGGTEAQLLELIQNLDRKRFEPLLTVFRPSAYLKEHPFPCPVEVLHIGKLAHPGALFRLLRMSYSIWRSGIGMVHILLNDASIVAPFFCKVGGSKVSVSRRDMGFWYNGANLAALKVSNLFVDRIVANSRAVQANVIQRESIPESNTAVIYNGHHSERFDLPPSGDFRKRYGIGLDDPVIGMVANLKPIKRQSDLIRAFAIIKEEIPNAHLVFVGGGQKEEALLGDLVRSLQIEQNVHILGDISEVVPIVKHFDVGVLCSESEGLSNAIIEYMGCAKPTVCTRTGGNAELIDNGYNGFLVDVGDIKGLAGRIRQFLSDPALACTFGERARSRILQQFSVQKMTDSYMDLYEELLCETRRSDGK